VVEDHFLGKGNRCSCSGGTVVSWQRDEWDTSWRVRVEGGWGCVFISVPHWTRALFNSYLAQSPTLSRRITILKITAANIKKNLPAIYQRPRQVASDNFFAPLGDMLMQNVDANREGGSNVTSAAGEVLSMRRPPHRPNYLVCKPVQTAWLVQLWP
jgi:hypothetical protein